MDKKLLDILVCPICKGKLVYQKSAGELVCKVDRLAYPIRDGIPIMLVDEADTLDEAAWEAAMAAPGPVGQGVVPSSGDTA